MTDPNLVGGGGVDAAELSRIDDSAVAAKKPRSLWSDAWRQLRRKPAFVISAVIIVLVVLILAAVTFGALAIRRRRQELAVGADGRQPRDRTTGGGRGPDRPGDGDPSATQAPDEPDTPTERRPAGDLND